MICTIGIVTVDEQTASDFSHLWVTACNAAAKAIEENEQFKDRVELFEIDDDIPPRSPS
jgi:hypothetical protein